MIVLNFFFLYPWINVNVGAMHFDFGKHDESDKQLDEFSSIIRFIQTHWE